MEIMVNAVKFKADEKLVEFIEKKMKKVATLLPQAMKAEVTLKVDKDQSEKNKIGEVPPSSATRLKKPWICA